MKRLSIILFAAALAPFLASCTNPINAYTAQQYYDYGVQAERGGDLALAQRHFSRAYGNAQMGNLGPKAEAYYLYEFARVTGYAGSYAESEKAFLDVLALISKAKGEADKLQAAAHIKDGEKLHYPKGDIEIVFVAGKAGWITVSAMSELPFSPAALSALGLPASKPSFQNKNVIRWNSIPGYLEISIFPGQKNCDYAYVQVLTLAQ